MALDVTGMWPDIHEQIKNHYFAEWAFLLRVYQSRFYSGVK